MNPSAKKKKQNINHELRFGGCTVLLLSPIIFYTFIISINGLFSFVLNLIGETDEYLTDIEIFWNTLLALISIIFIVVGIKFIKRLWTLRQIGNHLRSEQACVATLMDTTYAEDRLHDHDLSDLTQQKSPTEKLNRGSQSSF